MSQLTLQQALDQAVQHHNAQRWQEAEVLYRQILAAKPDHADAMHLLGLLAFQFNQFEPAIELIGKAIALSPNVANFHYNFGQVLAAAGRIDESISHYRQAILLKNDFASAHNNLGTVYLAARRFDEATEAFQNALAIQPNCADYLSNLSNVLRICGQIDEAVVAAQKAIALQPDLAEAHNNFGAALLRQGHVSEAIDAYRRAIALQPNYALCNYNLAMALLFKGDFGAAWPLAEWRLKANELDLQIQNFTQPRWDGSELNGRRIMLNAEQGFGDVIQFLRYLSMVKDLGGKIILAVPREMVRLMQDLPDIEQVVTHGDPLPDFDVHCPLFSLPLMFKTTLETIPANVPYLHANPDLSSLWRNRLTDVQGRKKVGLAWLGRPTPDPLRSIPPELLVPLSQVQNVRFVRLQRKDGGPSPERLNLLDLSSDIHDFADTAALIDNLDLVITIDTATAHLAGAMGKPAWVLLPFSADWRWMANRADSPWYPTIRLFRQPTKGDWQAPIRQIVQELSRL